MAEKRRWTRVSWGLPVGTKGQGKALLEGRLRNISKTGFSMMTEDRLTRGIIYEFVVNPKVDPITLRGRVIHLQNEKSHYNVGIRFEGLSVREKSKLNRFLSPYAKEIKTTSLIYSIIGGILVGLSVNFLFAPSLAALLAAGFGTTILLFIVMPF